MTELLLKVRFICKYWQLSSWDGTVWIITFLVTFIVQISYGLIAGIVVSLLVICIEGNQLHTCLLGIVPNTDLYLDVEKYKAVGIFCYLFNTVSSTIPASHVKITVLSDSMTSSVKYFRTSVTFFWYY